MMMFSMTIIVCLCVFSLDVFFFDKLYAERKIKHFVYKNNNNKQTNKQTISKNLKNRDHQKMK